MSHRNDLVRPIPRADETLLRSLKFRCFQKRLANVVSHMRYSWPLNTEANRYFKNPLEPGYHDKMKIITHSKHLKREICWTLQGDDNLQPLFRRELFLGMFWAIYAWSMLWSRVVLILRFTSHLYNSPLAHSHIWHRQAHGHPSEKSADTPHQRRRSMYSHRTLFKLEAWNHHGFNV